MSRLAIAIIIAITLLPALPANAQTPLVSIDPPGTITGSGATITLGVHVSAETTSLMGWNIAVTFDPAILQLLSVDEGTLPLTSGYTTFFQWMNPAGVDSVHVNGAILGHTVDGPGTLFTLTFKATAVGTAKQTTVVIASSVIRNGVNQDIAHDVQDGEVTVELPIAVESTTWGAVKALYR